MFLYGDKVCVRAYISQPEFESISRIAAERGISMSQLLRGLIIEHIEANERAVA